MIYLKEWVKISESDLYWKYTFSRENKIAVVIGFIIFLLFFLIFIISLNLILFIRIPNVELLFLIFLLVGFLINFFGSFIPAYATYEKKKNLFVIGFGLEIASWSLLLVSTTYFIYKFLGRDYIFLPLTLYIITIVQCILELIVFKIFNPFISKFKFKARICINCHKLVNKPGKYCEFCGYKITKSQNSIKD